MKRKFTRFSHWIGSIVISICFQPLASQPIVKYDNFISSGLTAPIEIVNAGDGSGRLFIVEKGGAIKVWTGGSTVLATPFLTIPSATLASGDEQGLLSLAFHPNFRTNGFFYVYYTRSDRALVVARYHADAAGNIAEPTGTELLAIAHPFDNHNGGHLQFRTEGGIRYLYFATGDGGSSNDPGNNSQNDASMLGKIIRINVDLSLPLTPEIYAKGLRNPFRWSFDRATGNMWIGDVGQGLKEEVDFWPAAGGSGANFGWRCFEGTVQNADVSPQCNPTGKIAPVFQYDNPPGNPPSAVTGGYVYRGSNSSLAGYYITADFYSGQLWILNANGSVARTQTNLANNIAAFGENEAGELYAVSITGNAVYSISATAGGTLPVSLLNFSAKQFSGYNELNWSSSFEQNAGRYIIEYSADGINYTVAGEVLAVNNSAGSNYSFRHNTANPGKIFYRLRIVDLDANTRYSPIVTVGGKNSGDVKIYPTLVQNGRLEFNAGIAVDYLRIHDFTGKEIYSSRLTGRQGYFSVQLPSLLKGYYFVSVESGDYHKTEKVFIQ